MSTKTEQNRMGLRSWRLVAEEYHRRTGETIGRTHAEKIGRRALAKIRRALMRQGHIQAGSR